jgi:diacylglycerol kinase (ATP)
MSGIGIITNPHSKLNKRNPKRQELLGYIVGSHGRLEITNSLEDIGRVANEFLENGVEILAINGGDGTISRTLTAFVNAYGDTPLPKVAILRGGTINVLASNLGIKGSPEQILYRLTESFSQKGALKTRKLATLDIEKNIGFLFGNGTVPNFLKEYYKRKSGRLGAGLYAVRVLLSRFFGSRTYSTVVKDDEQVIEFANGGSVSHQSISVLCSTVPLMPLDVPLFTKIRDVVDNFQIVSFSFSASRALWLFPLTLLKNRKESLKTRISLLAPQISLGSSNVFDYTLDGEIFTSTNNKIDIGMGPQIDFIVV